MFVTDVCVFGETAAMNFFAKTGFHCLKLTNICFLSIIILKQGCTHMIRAHQPPTIGAHFTRNGTTLSICDTFQNVHLSVRIVSPARVITVFSSSHYCGGYNAAAVILIDKRRLQVSFFNRKKKYVKFTFLIKQQVIVTQISTKVEDGAGEIVQSVASTHNSDDEESSSSSSSYVFKKRMILKIEICFFDIGVVQKVLWQLMTTRHYSQMRATRTQRRGQLPTLSSR